MLVSDMGIVSNLLLVSAASASVWAGTVTVTDPFNTGGSSDVIGDRLLFDAQSVQVTTGNGTLSIDIRTNYQNSHLYSYVDTGVRVDPGDLFFTVNGQSAYGIPLAYHNGPAGGPWGDRLYAGHIYQITDPSKALMTSDQVLHDPEYFDYRPDTTVWMMDDGGVRDVTTGSPSVTVQSIAGDNGLNGPLFDIHIQTSLPAGLFSTPGDTYGLQWAVDTGANDVVQGTLNFPQQLGRLAAGSSVPEPGTAYLMIGAALVGLSRIAVRRS
jgi:hypothetical protein